MVRISDQSSRDGGNVVAPQQYHRAERDRGDPQPLGVAGDPPAGTTQRLAGQPGPSGLQAGGQRWRGQLPERVEPANQPATTRIRPSHRITFQPRSR